MAAMKRILLIINSPQKGLLVSIGRSLEQRGHRVFFSARDRDVREVIRKLLPHIDDSSIDVRADYTTDQASLDVVSECLKREREFNETFSMICSYDRALGKGYIFNADRYPDILRSWWSQEKKYGEILKEFLYYESVLKKFEVDVILAFGNSKVLSLMARKKGMLYATIDSARYKANYLWVENEHYQNFKFEKAVEENLARDGGGLENEERIEYEQNYIAKSVFQLLDYSYSHAFKTALKRVLIESANRLRGRYKKNSYRFLGWVPSMLRRPYVFNYLSRYGSKPGQLKDRRVIFFPLHFEPESSLLALSPELNNSMEIIAWISKSAPADTVVAVKEHPDCFGVRSRHYYDHFRKMANVVLAHPETTSWQWIERSSVVATITGTAGLEAVYFRKPVLSFGKYQVINRLPTVRYANTYESVKAGLEDLMNLEQDGGRFDASRKALHHALLSVSVELPGFEKTYDSCEMHPDMAEALVNNLYAQFPATFER